MSYPFSEVRTETPGCTNKCLIFVAWWSIRAAAHVPSFMPLPVRNRKSNLAETPFHRSNNCKDKRLAWYSWSSMIWLELNEICSFHSSTNKNIQENPSDEDAPNLFCLGARRRRASLAKHRRTRLVDWGFSHMRYKEPLVQNNPKVGRRVGVIAVIRALRSMRSKPSALRYRGEHGTCFFGQLQWYRYRSQLHLYKEKVRLGDPSLGMSCYVTVGQMYLFGFLWSSGRSGVRFSHAPRHREVCCS